MGLRNSSRRISPGGIAGPNQFGSLMIVFDADFVRMSLLPEKGYSILKAFASGLLLFAGHQGRVRQVFAGFSARRAKLRRLTTCYLPGPDVTTRSSDPISAMSTRSG